jgi:cytochrome b561
MSTLSVSPARYSAVAITLHWLIAILLISNIGLAWYFNTLQGLERTAPTQLHKSIGITILLLSLARLAWRLISPPPKLAADLPRWQRYAAHTVHGLLYVVMIGSPLTGWALTSASRLIHVYPITLYGVVPWPAIGPLTTLPHDQMKQAHGAFLTTHELLAKLAYLLIILHVGAALMHQFIQRDGTLSRMVPFLKARAA